MCIACFRPSNINLTRAVLHRMYNNNPDGCGIAYPDDKGKSMIVIRGLFGFRKFWKLYREVPKDKPMLIHFRIATSGQVDKSNCHPWLIDNKHALIHNGNIESKLEEKVEETSDTGIFVEKILKPIFADPILKKRKLWWKKDSFKWLMENSIGSNNKIVILAANGEEQIFNEKAGEWEDGAWFSNKTFKEDRKVIKGSSSKIITENGQRKEEITFSSGRKTYRYLEPISTTTPIIYDSLMPPPHFSTLPMGPMKKEDILSSEEFQNIIDNHEKIDVVEII